ncbi:MAG: phosphotransferase, partial [Woeseiaceae bacterium]|nr:phosphotransferase [Woeseiaceae bacterium]
MAVPVTPYAAVSTAPPTVPESIVAEAIEEQYALNGGFTPLISERDQNFRLSSGSGKDYVVKVTSLAETPLASAFRTAVLRHLEDLGTRGVPRLVRTGDGGCGGELEYEGQCYALRVVRYLDGDLLASVAIDPVLARDFGTKLAAFDTALGGFRHAGESPLLLWDLQRATELRELLGFIDDGALGRRVARAIDDFEANVAPQIKALRTQVIHGDANPENILVAPSRRSVSGFIDFGDMLR